MAVISPNVDVTGFRHSSAGGVGSPCLFLSSPRSSSSCLWTAGASVIVGGCCCCCHRRCRAVAASVSLESSERAAPAALSPGICHLDWEPSGRDLLAYTATPMRASVTARRAKTPHRRTRRGFFFVSFAPVVPRG